MEIEIKKSYKINNFVQHYDWGDKDFIPSLIGDENIKNVAFAELWMGSHPKASSILEDGTTLFKLINDSPTAVLGKQISTQFGQLPYLLKVLSASSPLSIQAHPDKIKAEQGFALENSKGIPLDAFERNYKDNNHKPEIIAALTPFWAMKGFRRVSKIINLLEEINCTQLLEVASPLYNSEFSESEKLKGFFFSLLELDKKSSKKILTDILSKIENSNNSIFNWVEKLHSFYPGDIGVLAPIYLNLIHLKPGEALFLEAGVLHAYLEGSGMELMANSDNVLRGGLTPKNVDLKELSDVLLFVSDDAKILEPNKGEDDWYHYKTPSNEFSLSKINLDGTVCLGSPVSPSIILCLEGKGEIAGNVISKGETLFLPYNSRSLSFSGKGIFYKASVS